MGFPGGAVVENLPANAGDTGSSPGLGTEIPQLHGVAKTKNKKQKNPDTYQMTFFFDAEVCYWQLIS